MGAEPTRKKRCNRRSAVSSSTANKNKKFTTGGARIDAGDTSEMGKYGSDNVTENSCFAQKASMDDLIGINFQSFAAAVIPMDWGNRTYANTAAKNCSQLDD